MKKIILSALLSCVSVAAHSADAVAPAVQLSSPAGAEVYFVDLADGAKVHSPVVVHFGLKGMGIAPAGIQMDDTGHHHLFIDTDVPTDLTKPIPSAQEGKIMHFGKGQTEVSLTLSPGKHTLQLLLGDYLHKPHNPAVMSKKITIEVVK